MKLALRIYVALVSAFILCGTALPACADVLDQIKTAFEKGEYAAVIHAYEQLAQADQNRAMPLFWTGVSYMRRHDYKQARPFLQKAVSANLPSQQQGFATNLLSRIQTLEQLCPPFFKTYQSGGFTINVYAQDAAWGRAVAAQMPQFLARAQEAFGNQTAAINFYLFDQRPPYDRFFGAWTGDQGTEKHRGTGVMHMVEFCQFFPDGRQIGAKNPNDLYFRILHEYSHALCNTIYGDTYGSDCPQWLNESLADYFGWKYLPERYGQQSQLLAQLAAKTPPLSYEDISQHLYKQDGGYVVPDLLLLELLKGKDVSCYRQILETAKSHNGDFEAALRQLTGKDPRSVYQEIVRTYWR